MGSFAKFSKCLKWIGDRCIPGCFGKKSAPVSTKLQEAFRASKVDVLSATKINDPSEMDEVVGSNKQPLIDLLLSLTDFYDEIQLLSTIPSSSELANVVREKLRDKIELAGGKLISGAEWNPKAQRAVKVLASESPYDPVRVTNSISTGLIFKAAILRKQEVIISKPTEPNHP
jgi:hypothetical protein